MANRRDQEANRTHEMLAELEPHLALAPVDFEGRADSLNMQTLHELTNNLDALIAHATRLSAYFQARASGQEHATAVRVSNIKVRSVRRALGYNETPDLSY